MTSLTFPDINVWLAVLTADHSRRKQAQDWWRQDQSDGLAFVRLTQIGVLRLLTTSGVMNGRLLTMAEAWSAYDRLFEDERVVFLDEPQGLEVIFRRFTQSTLSSPKLWADAWLTTFAEIQGGSIVTLDRALAARCSNSILLA